LAQVAQLVEQGIENPRVGGSIPSLGTTDIKQEASATRWGFLLSASGIFRVPLFRLRDKQLQPGDTHDSAMCYRSANGLAVTETLC
jgi:hypothetical protein